MQRILLGIAVALLAAALAGLTVIAVRDVTRDVAAPRIAERVRTVEAAAVSLGETFARMRTQATVLTQSVGPWGTVPAGEVGPSLDAVASLTPAFAERFVVDETGRVVATADASAAFLNLARPGPYLQQAFHGDAAASGITLDPLLRVPVIYVAAPVRADDASPAVVAVGLVRLDAGILTDQLAAIPLPPAAQLALVDPDSTVARPGGVTEIEPAGPELAAPAVLGRAERGSVEFEGIAGVAAIAAYAPVDDGWSLVMTQEAAAFTPFAESTRAAGAALPGAVALAVLPVAIYVVLDRRARRARQREKDAKRAFLAVSGHELRTPVTVINGMIQTLLARKAEIDPALLERALRMMDVHGRRLHLNIERILFVAQLETGGAFRLYTRDIDIVPVIDRAVEHAAALSPVHDVTIEVATPTLIARADATAVEQILVQLLDNAIRYSPAEGPIRVSAAPAGRWIRILVEDEGIGLPSDTSRLFELFTQGEAVDTRVRDEGGIGLGLALVRTLTEAMDGRVRLERRDPGTRAVVEIPAAGSQPGAHPES
ncbi:MAG: sensor histidine kinase [Actinobacteria bacterium]|nr:sensor histidine kinase [Actinomycetota bacterium]